MLSDRPGETHPAYEARLRNRIRELEHDAIERRQSRDALQLREARLLEAQRIAHLGSWEWDVVRDEVFWSDEMFRIFGMEKGDFEGTFEGFLSHVHPADRGIIREQLGATFNRNEPYLLEFRIERADGPIRCVRTEGWLDRDADGTPTRLVGTCLDITIQKREETQRRQLLEQAQRVRRLEGLAILADGLANDFKNLLTAVDGQVELARRTIDPDSPAHEHLDGIDRTAVRFTDLIDRLIACAGRSPGKWTDVDLNQVVSRCMEGIDRRVTMCSTVRYDLVDGLPLVRGDFDQLCQVLSALVDNAGQSINTPNGSIVVATGVMHIDGTHLAAAYLAEDLPEGRYAYVRVADNGCGLDDVAVEHVFDPFYTTKGPGRGLGLTWVAGAVRSHRGAVIIDSEPTRGSLFTVLLPVSAPTKEGRTHGARADLGEWMDGGQIVVVDDEPAVRSVVKLLVERRGFDVLLARDGVEGLEVVAQTRAPIRAVLLDLNMPRMGGEEMFTLLRREQPEVPVVVMTGTADLDIVERLRSKPRVRVLQKPFRAAALMDRLHSVLYDVESSPRGSGAVLPKPIS